MKENERVRVVLCDTQGCDPRGKTLDAPFDLCDVTCACFARSMDKVMWIRCTHHRRTSMARKENDGETRDARVPFVETLFY